MAMEITTPAAQLPTDPLTGLTLPLSKSLGSRALTEHSAMIAVELEVMAKKYDRFGWDRDRNTPVHDRLVMDWIAALRDFPLDEVRAACAAWVRDKPRQMPNEGDIRGKVIEARAERVAAQRRAPPPPVESPRVSREAAAAIMAASGYGPRKMVGADA